MTGTILNVAAILAGTAVGRLSARRLNAETEGAMKSVLGVLVVYVGLSTTWKAVNGSFGQCLAQLGIVMLSLVLGNAVGMAMRLQKAVNALGQSARSAFEKASSESQSGSRFSEGFTTCSLLFCVGPMALLGSLQDGLSGDYRTLGLKALIDGLSCVAFARTFGWGVGLAALPVLAYQGTITLSARLLDPWLKNQLMLDSINATGGLLVVCTALIILDVRKVPLANYLPSLLVAPVLTHWWR